VQLPTTIGLRRSRLVDGILLVSTVFGLLALAFVAWPLFTSCLLAVVTLLAAFSAAHALTPRIRALRIAEDGRVSCLAAAGESEFSPVRVLPGATAHPWLTVMRLAHEERKSLIVVAPDSAAPDEFRRLRVWLRWRAPVSDVSGDS
jgi:toxin CptA